MAKLYQANELVIYVDRNQKRYAAKFTDYEYSGKVRIEQHRVVEVVQVDHTRIVRDHKNINQKGVYKLKVFWDGHNNQLLKGEVYFVAKNDEIITKASRLLTSLEEILYL